MLKLPADLAAALNKRCLKLFLYSHLGATEDVEWLKASGFWETDTSKCFNHWRSVITEAGERYGDKLAGWWFDDGATSYYYRSAPWKSLARAAKAGNPRRLISFNTWELNNPTEFHDYCTGEACYDLRGMDALLTPECKGFYPSGTHAGLQASACLIADANWVHAWKDTPLSAPKWNAAQLADLIRQFMAHKNVPIFNLEIAQDGQLSSQSIAVFKEAAARLATTQPDLTREAEVNGDRTPADAYGGNRKVEQPLTPAEAKVPFLIPDEIAPGPFQADWKSFTADKLQREPSWWREAKIGVWFHWGPQSMGRNGDWYARFLYQQPPQGRQGRASGRWMYDEHLKRFGHPSEFGYMDVLNAWKAPKFDPAKLMKLYADSGARYILVQGAHHDNFDLWNSKYQPWNSVNVGPKRDIVGEMFREARKYNFRTGMAFHADYSLWWFQPAFGADKTGPKAGVPYDAATRTKENGKGQWWEGLDPKDLYGIDLQAEVLPGQNIRDGFFTPVRDIVVHPETRAFAKEYTLKWFHRVRQFVDDYDPDMLYTDGTEPFTGRGTAKGVISDAAVKVVAHMYNHRAAKNGGVVDCMAVIKGGPRIPGIAAPHENGYTGPIKREPWVWENTVGEWFFEENTLYDSRAMIFQMIEAISRDGNFNLNIGLTPEGDLEPGGVKMWQDFGEFTRRNAAAIYGSSAWKIIGEDAASNAIPRAFPSGPIVREHAEFAMATSDVRFTQGKDGSVYAFVMAVPRPGETLRIRSLGRNAGLLEQTPRTVELLGSRARLDWKQDADALVIRYPPSASLPFTVVFRIK
jgi:alpha-L-fucosidase